MRIGSIEDSVKNFANRLVFSREALAIYAGVAALALANSAPAESDSSGPSVKLERISQLPGYDINVSNQAKLDLQDSSVIVKDYEPVISNSGGTSVVDQDPSGWCSANKFRYDSINFISLAAHCVANITGVPDGIIDPTEYPGPKTGAFNFIQATNLDFQIYDPNVNRGRSAEIASTTGIDVSTEDTDAALLEVSEVQQSQNKDGSYPVSFSDIKAIPYGPTPTFTPGEEVAMFSSPESSLSPVKEVGRYIGTYYNYSTGGVGSSLTYQYVPKYVVVTDPKTSAQDACFYGASGSAFSAMDTKNNSIIGEHGRVGFSGPLSVRISLKDVGITDASSSMPITKEEEDAWRKEVETQLQIAIPKQDTICEYSVLTPGIKSALANSFGNYITKYGS